MWAQNARIFLNALSRADRTRIGLGRTLISSYPRSRSNSLSVSTSPLPFRPRAHHLHFQNSEAVKSPPVFIPIGERSALTPTSLASCGRLSIGRLPRWRRTAAVANRRDCRSQAQSRPPGSRARQRGGRVGVRNIVGLLTKKRPRYPSIAGPPCNRTRVRDQKLNRRASCRGQIGRA